MTRITVSRARPSPEPRCLVCHRRVRERGLACWSCAGVAHEGCVPAADPAGTSCPVEGCLGRLVAAEKGRPLAAATDAPGPHVAPSTRSGAARAGPRPRLFWRIGPWVRLAVSALVNGAVLVACGSAVLTFLADPSGFWEAAGRGRGGAHSDVHALAFFLFAAVIVLGLGWLALRWLLRIGPVAREVQELLERDDPIRMRIWIAFVPKGRWGDWWATLRADDGRHLGFRLTGILPPWWLYFMRKDTPVWVYGYPPPGPYLLEFDDGRLALVHPDEET